METDEEESGGRTACEVERGVEETKLRETSKLSKKNLHAAFTERGISACCSRTFAWSGGILWGQRACKQHGWEPGTAHLLCENR